MSLSIEDIIQCGTALPSFVDYQYYKCLENNTILINDDISDSLIEMALLPLLQMDQDKNIDHIDILLNTYGGQIYPGMAFVAALENATTPITVQILGVAASMGIYIAMAKGPYITTVCNPWSVGLIHAGSYFIDSDLNAARDMFAFNEHYENKLKEFVLSRTEITEDAYNKIERVEHWIDAEKMLEYGIVDKIIGAEE